MNTSRYSMRDRKVSAEARQNAFPGRPRPRDHCGRGHCRFWGNQKFHKKSSLEFLKNRTSGIPRICGFRDFEDSEISRNLKFLAVPVLCHDNVMQPRKGSWARGARARGRVLDAFPHVHLYPQCPTIAQGQVWENRKFAISKIW